MYEQDFQKKNIQYFVVKLSLELQTLLVPIYTVKFWTLSVRTRGQSILRKWLYKKYTEWKNKYSRRENSYFSTVVVHSAFKYLLNAKPGKVKQWKVLLLLFIKKLMLSATFIHNAEVP